MALGIYISVPFCRTKCTYCNFASGVFSRRRYATYVDSICADIHNAERTAEDMDALVESDADSIYLGGGTPSILERSQLERIFAAINSEFKLSNDSEITVECAPGTLSAELIETLLGCGVNRVSLGVQSFVDEETRAVGRLHTRATVLEDVARLRAAGIHNINVDLIAGLPHQTEESWVRSLGDALAIGVPHVSVYMLEVDEDSRLGKELIAGGKLYHAHFVPDEGLTADLYEIACERLEAAGIEQYEISNFARAGWRSKHNLKYWTRQPYIGFGVDAHSMLLPNAEVKAAGVNAIRYFWPDSLEQFLGHGEDREPANEIISELSALEETMFLSLRLNRGLDLCEAERQFGRDEVAGIADKIADVCNMGLVTHEHGILRLTPRGRLLSNEVFEKFVGLRITEDELWEFLEAERLGEESPVPDRGKPH